MGQPKLSPDVAKLSARYPADVFGDPKSIAQRLVSAESEKAGSRVAVLPAAPRQADPQTETKASLSAARWVLSRPRLLIGALSATLIPCLILAVLWFASSGEPQATRAAPIAEPQAETVAVLTASDRIEAVAGQTVKFSLAIDGTDGVPPRSVIAIKGLPQGSNFSEGRPYGESEWNLRPDQIGDLSLVLPADTTGKFKLSMALIAPDDRVIAEAETLVVASAPVVPPQPVAAEESGLTSPASGEMPASALYGTEAAILNLPEANEAPVPEPNAENAGSARAPIPSGSADGETAALEATTMGTASVPSRAAPPDQADLASDGANALGTVQPAVFVNLREGPSSSSPVLGVIAKGADLPVLDRKRGWVQVAHPETGKQGWIYSGLLVGEAKTSHRVRRVAPAEAEPKSETFWGRLGRWLSPSKEDAPKEN